MGLDIENCTFDNARWSNVVHRAHKNRAADLQKLSGSSNQTIKYNFLGGLAHIQSEVNWVLNRMTGFALQERAIIDKNVVFADISEFGVNKQAADSFISQPDIYYGDIVEIERGYLQQAKEIVCLGKTVCEIEQGQDNTHNNGLLYLPDRKEVSEVSYKSPDKILEEMQKCVSGACEDIKSRLELMHGESITEQYDRHISDAYDDTMKLHWDNAKSRFNFSWKMPFSMIFALKDLTLYTLTKIQSMMNYCLDPLTGVKAAEFAEIVSWTVYDADRTLDGNECRAGYDPQYTTQVKSNKSCHNKLWSEIKDIYAVTNDININGQMVDLQSYWSDMGELLDDLLGQGSTFSEQGEAT